MRVSSGAKIAIGNVAAAIPFLYLLYTKRLYLDFWLDEAISIRRHIVTTIDRALFWYPIPNNHVFTNALSGLYLQVLGAKNLGSVLEHPEILRIFYASFALAAVLVSSYTAYRFVSRTASLVTVILWTTTIPFLNFAAQARGYAPSFFFIATLVLSILLYREQPRLGPGLGILLSAATLFYTMPSNIYLLAGLSFYLGITLTELRKAASRTSLKPKDFQFVNPAFSIGIFIGLGCLLALLLYLPILEDVLQNRYVQTLGLFQGTALSSSLPAIFSALISRRWALFGIAALGLLATLLAGKRTKTLWLAGLLGSGLLLPFLISVIRGDDPPARTFLFIMPLFFLLTTMGLDHLIKEISERTSVKWAGTVLILALFGYANLVFYSYHAEVSNLIREVLVNEDVDFIELRDDRLTASVYLEHYAVRKVIDEFMSAAEPGVPVIVDADNTRYDFALTTYMENYDIEYESIEDLAAIPQARVYLFLSYSQKTISELSEFFPGVACEPMTVTLSVYKALDCRLR